MTNEIIVLLNIKTIMINMIVYNNTHNDNNSSSNNNNMNIITWLEQVKKPPTSHKQRSTMSTWKLVSLLSALFQTQSGFNSLKSNRLKPDRVWKIAESNEKSFWVALQSLLGWHYLGGTTCLTLLVQYGLICSLQHYLSNTANRICCFIRHF